MLYSYKTLKKECQDEFIEKKSRFIGYACPVTTEQQALDFINKINKKHYDATHNVYAYVLKDNNIRRYSDDGEPSGTAGVPVLDVILKEGLTDVCVVATRYFGGIMLGAGGLVRAYTKSAKVGIDACGILERKFCYQCEMKCDYTLLGKIQSEIIAYGCIPGEVEYTDKVRIHCFIPYDITGFDERITDITNGKTIIKIKKEGRFIDVN